MNPNRRLLAATLTYALAAGAIVFSSLSTSGGSSTPNCSTPTLARVALGAVEGAGAGVLLYSLSFATAGVAGLWLSSQIPLHFTYLGWMGILACCSLVAPLVFGFSDFLSVYMARSMGFAKSLRSFVKYLACAALMGASAGVGVCISCADIHLVEQISNPIVAGSLSLAAPLLVYLRTESIRVRAGSLALTSALMALVLAVLSRLNAGEVGFVALAVPWLLPERAFRPLSEELPRPPVALLRARGSNLREEISKLKRALEEFYVEGGL